jgi:hypothetical protein
MWASILELNLGGLSVKQKKQGPGAVISIYAWCSELLSTHHRVTCCVR